MPAAQCIIRARPALLLTLYGKQHNRVVEKPGISPVRATMPGRGRGTRGWPGLVVVVGGRVMVVSVCRSVYWCTVVRAGRRPGAAARTTAAPLLYYTQ